MLRIFAVQLSLASHLLLQARSFESDVDGRFCEHTSLLQISLQLASPAKEHISIKDSRRSGAVEETSTTETTTIETTMETTTTTLDPDLPFVNLTNVTDTIVDPTEADKITGPAALRDAFEKQTLTNTTSSTPVVVVAAPFPSPAPPAASILDGAEEVTTTTTLPPLQVSSSTTTIAIEAAPYSQGTNLSISSPTLKPLNNLTAKEVSALNQSRAQAALDCIVAAWSEWSACGLLGSAGDGGIHEKVQQRQRSILTPQSLGGAACPELTEIQDCDSDSDTGTTTSSASD
jgi:hypothetical protein|mmetsp:Transcript_102005/g.161205  ORF Transcript_102005/g.161205 Transcript_102005/m.161205 type:complete len:289 (+) Transcript_102005:69-935(+)